jgi:glycosyltransferase involved in cell wall biosynthesis
LLIAFDSFFLAERFRNVGTYEYAKNLLGESRRAAGHSIDICYFVSQNDLQGQARIEFGTPCRMVETAMLAYPWPWRLGLASWASVRAGADLLFSPSPQIVPWDVVPVAVTIHDAIPSKLPPELLGGRSLMLRMLTRAAAKRSVRILTDSEASKKDLVDIYNLPPEKVSVVYLGYDKERFNTFATDPSAQARLLTRLGIRRPYILHHGMVQLRKNLRRLIDAYRILVKRHHGFEFQLVLAGRLGFGAEELRRSAGTNLGKGDVVFPGPLTDDQLSLLVKGASLCVIPSLAEGFCLPMVESMACGVPTIAANCSCLPEISGNYLRYFDPLSVEDIAATIAAVLEHTDTQRDLVRKGVQRASEFSWQRCAKETLAVLTNVHGEVTAVSNDGLSGGVVA